MHNHVTCDDSVWKSNKHENPGGLSCMTEYGWEWSVNYTRLWVIDQHCCYCWQQQVTWESTRNKLYWLINIQHTQECGYSRDVHTHRSFLLLEIINRLAIHHLQTCTLPAKPKTHHTEYNWWHHKCNCDSNGRKNAFSGVPAGKINFRTKFFSKFQDNFRTFCRFHKVQNTENPYILLAWISHAELNTVQDTQRQ